MNAPNTCAAAPSPQQQRDLLVEALRRFVTEDEACRFDVLNPCWNWRPTDVVGRHWGGGIACSLCNARGVLSLVCGGPTR